MKMMGNRLVELTDILIKKINNFFNRFNKTMTYVKLEQFIFQEADYMEVALKECDEIAQIFSAYDIHINKVENEYIPFKLPPGQKTADSSNVPSTV